MEKKTCNTCGNEKPVKEFSIRKRKGKLEYQHWCKVCHSEYRKKHYLANKSKYIQKAKEYKTTTKKTVNDYKKFNQCLNCGEDRWWVLDFHHRDPSEKEDLISNLAQWGSKKKLEKEIKKCDVLCANCHRDLHYKENLHP